MIASLRWVLMCLVVAPMMGCAAFGAFEYAAMGPPVQPARYEPARKPMVVFVENYRSPSAVALDADRLGSMVARELAVNDVVPVVSPEALFSLREQKGTAFGEMRISEIGQAVGAEQVLYIELLASRAEQPTGELMKASMSARVKVVDAADGRTLWPADMSEGYAMQYETPMKLREEQVSLSSVREEMLRTMARRTARLFYAWKPSDSKEADEG